jgi:hypothetical protein
MQLTSAVAELLSGHVMVLIGTDSASGWPRIARALGARVVDPHRMALVYSASRYPEIARDLEMHDRIAVTAARVSDYTCCQIKGVGVVQAPDAEDEAMAEAYRQRLTDFFEAAGTSLEAIDQWLGGADLQCVRIAVREVYDQTPGRQAGKAIGRAVPI